MGMFDTIICKYPLPLPQYQDWDFQTKDLECQLSLYQIRKNGTLWRREFDIKKSKNSRIVKKKWERCIITEEVFFYTNVGDIHAPYSGWVEFKASFKDGKLKEMIIHEHRAPERRLTHEVNDS